MIIPDSKKMASIIVAKLKPSSGDMDMHPDEHEDKERDEDQEGLEACAQDIMDALEKKDVKAFATALHDFFELADSLPQEEGPHGDEMEEEIGDHDMFPKIGLK